MRETMKQVGVAALTVVVGLLLLAWFFLYSGSVFITPAKNAPNRDAVARIYNEVDVGDSYRSVLEAYFEERTDALKLIFVTPRMLRIVTPLEPGANNWVLVVEFEGDAVSAVKVRTSDGPVSRDGPKDKLK